MGKDENPFAQFGHWLAKTLGFYQSPPPRVRKTTEPEVLGPSQKKRAEDRLAKLPEEERRKYEALESAAKSPKEKDYLRKGLACNYSIDEVEAFARKINGKDDKWMEENLKLTSSSSGKGIKQQWKHSCNATTVQAIRGELDPLYALKLHEENADLTAADNSDGAKMNAKLAAEQKTMLESQRSGGGSGGTAVNRGAAGGAGRWADDLMNNMSDVTGVKYENKTFGWTYGVSAALSDIDNAIAKGHPVPIVIGNASDQFTHYVLVTNYDDGPPKMYTVHDPWDGVTVTRSAEDMANGKINLAGSNQITSLDLPSDV